MTYGHANYRAEILERTQNPGNKVLFRDNTVGAQAACSSSHISKGRSLSCLFVPDRVMLGKSRLRGKSNPLASAS